MQKNIFIIVLLLSFNLLQADTIKNQDRWIKMNNIVKDTKLGLIWQDSKSTKIRKKRWEDGKQYCANLTLSGANNWRLPSYNELLSIVNYSRHEPSIVKPFRNTNKTGYYWTSTDVITNAAYAWYVSAQFGLTYTYSKDEVCYIRCVRTAKRG
jgi:hypothetical protein